MFRLLNDTFVVHVKEGIITTDGMVVINGNFKSVDVSPDGQYAGIDATTGKLMFNGQWIDHDEQFEHVKLYEGSWIASTKTKVYGLELLYESPYEITQLEFGFDGSILIGTVIGCIICKTAFEAYSLAIMDHAKIRKILIQHNNKLNNTLQYTDEFNIIRRWNNDRGFPSILIPMDTYGKITSMDISPDGEHLACVTDLNQIYVFATASQLMVKTWDIDATHVCWLNNQSFCIFNNVTFYHVFLTL
jgi:WD40 repeat protein